MTITEIFYCTLGFCVVSLPLYLVYRPSNERKKGHLLIFVPGFIVANIISSHLSRAGDMLFHKSIIAVDQPIYIGFPFSFWRVGPRSNNILFFPLLLNIVIIALLTFFYFHPDNQGASHSRGYKEKKETTFFFCVKIKLAGMMARIK